MSPHLPTLRGTVGDVFEITLVNDDKDMGHGIDFHAGSLAPDRPMRTLQPGERLVYRFRAKPPERLSAVEKRLLAVADLRAEVNEGGFQQYFSDAAGNQAALALQGYREMGATSLAKTVQRALAAFPNAKPPATPEARQKFIAQSRRRVEGVWGSCDDEFHLRDEAYPALALAYAKKNRSQIVLP